LQQHDIDANTALSDCDEDMIVEDIDGDEDMIVDIDGDEDMIVEDMIVENEHTEHSEQSTVSLATEKL
jgi:hypothetical protein